MARGLLLSVSWICLLLVNSIISSPVQKGFEPVVEEVPFNRLAGVTTDPTAILDPVILPSTYIVQAHSAFMRARDHYAELGYTKDYGPIPVQAPVKTPPKAPQRGRY